MKVVKAELAEFLKRASVNGMINELVLEENGQVNADFEDAVGVFGETDIKFKERIGLANVPMLLKIVSSLETADGIINVEIKNNREMTLATRNGKYNYRLADPDVITTMTKERPAFAELKAKLPVQVELPLASVLNLKKAITNLDAQRISFYANASRLEVVVYDDATKSTAVVELGECKESFKNDYLAREYASKILDLINTEGVILSLGSGSPMLITLKDQRFMYMISPMVVTNQDQAPAEAH